MYIFSLNYRTGFIGCFLEEMSVLWTLHPPHLLFLAFLLNVWNLLFSKNNWCIFFRQIRTGFIECFLEELSVLWTLHQPPLPTASHLRPSWRLLKRTLTTSNNSRYVCMVILIVKNSGKGYKISLILNVLQGYCWIVLNWHSAWYLKLVKFELSKSFFMSKIIFSCVKIIFAHFFR